MLENTEKNTIKGRSIHDKDKSGKNVNTDDLKFIICTKNPYDWLWSLYQFQKNKREVKEYTLNDFLCKDHTSTTQAKMQSMCLTK